MQLPSDIWRDDPEGLPESFWEDDPEPVAPPPPPVVVDDPGLDLRAKQQIISAFLQTPGGRQKLAASMTQPLRQRRDYQSLGQKVFMVEQMPQGALPLYDKDMDVLQAVLPDPEGDEE